MSENGSDKDQEKEVNINEGNLEEYVKNEYLNEDDINNSKKRRKLFRTKNSNGEEIVEYKDSSKTRIIVLISIVGVIICIVLTFAMIAGINRFNTNVYKNVYILGENLSGKTSEQVVEFLNEKNKQATGIEKVELYQGTQKIFEVKPEDIEFGIDVEKTTKAIMEFGRTGNILVDNAQILKVLFSSKSLNIEYSYNQQKLEDIVKNIDLSVESRFVDDSYSIDEENNRLIIVNGTSGNSIDYNTTQDDIVKNFIDSKNIYQLNIIKKEPKELNVDDIYSNIKRDPENAYVDESVTPNRYVSEKKGFDVDITKLKQILSEQENQTEGKSISFDLTVLEPKVKLSDITKNLYNDKLSGVTTYFDASQKARANNLSLALSYLNGKIVMPGETFSYNATIGDTTASKGYLEAATFKAGTVVMELGGGICQTTSTLYDAALKANLGIVERHQHGLPVGYVQPSLDATVYSPVLDFKFKNNRKYPVKIIASYSNSGSLNISIYGTKEETEYEIELTHKYISTIAYSTKYVYDSNLASGTEIVDVKGVNGYVSEGYITKKLNGVVVSSAMLSRDTYNPQQRVVRIGTANVNNQAPSGAGAS